jgi:hypothetical protein
MRTHIPIDNPPLGHGQRAPRAGCHWDPGSPPSRVPEFLLARSKINLLRHAIALPAGVEDVGWAGRGLVAVVQVCAAQCSHSLFYSDRVACAGALRVRGLIMISHGSNSLVVYIPGDGCNACARVGTEDQTRVCHGPDARDSIFCALAVGVAVACLANEATQPPTNVGVDECRLLRGLIRECRRLRGLIR